MSFLATAPDDGYPGTCPDPVSSAYGAGPGDTAPLADVAGPAGVAALAGLTRPARIAGPTGMASLADGTASGDHEEEPLVDPAALQDLGAGLDNPAAARDFARDYIKMWDHRHRSLAAALEQGDEIEALDAALSLKISSAMAGGIRLSRLAADIEEAIRGGDLDRARSFLPEVAEHGRETMDELQASQDLPEI